MTPNSIKSPFYLFMLLIILSSTLMIISSTNWLMVWMSFELNMLTFIPTLLTNKSSSELEAAIKYFLIQALSSNLLILSAILMMTSPHISSILPSLIITSLLIKSGLVPFHHWYPSMMNSISWLSCLLLSTWQKLGPLSLLIMSSVHWLPLYFLSAANALLGGLMGINQAKLRAMFAYSSLTHLGWLVSLMFSSTYPLIYFILYSMIITPLFLLLHKFNMNTTNNPLPLNMLWIIPLLLLSLGGLPPLTGFLPKWFALTYLMSQPAVTLPLIIGSSMSIFYYLSLTFSQAMSSPSLITNLPHSSSFMTTLASLSLFMLCPLIFL